MDSSGAAARALCSAPQTRDLNRREPLQRRTEAHVRRNSRLAGGEPYEPRSEREMGAAMRLFRAKVRATRQKGRRRGGRREGAAPSWSAESVLAYLWGIGVRFGRVFPSYEDIAAGAGCTIRAAVEAVSILETWGFLEKTRRCVATGERGVRGPQYQQTSNFYRVKLPTGAAALLDRWRRPQESEGDEVDRQKRRAFADACETMLAEQRKRDQEAASPAIARAQAKADRLLAEAAAAALAPG